MKATKLKMAALGVAAAFSLFAFSVINGGSIKGTVTPTASATGVMAISMTDTVRADITNGSFSISDVKAGTYKLVITAAAPFKNFEKEGVMVSEGKATDLGEITLQSSK